jgi:hypothetical protein
MGSCFDKAYIKLIRPMGEREKDVAESATGWLSVVLICTKVFFREMPLDVTYYNFSKTDNRGQGLYSDTIPASPA